MTITPLAIARRWRRKRHQVSLSWLATATRSSAAAVSSTAGLVLNRRASMGGPSIELVADAGIDPHQHQVRDEGADHRQRAEQQHDGAGEENVLRDQRAH